MEGTSQIKFQSSMIFSDRMNRIWTILKDNKQFTEMLTKSQINMLLNSKTVDVKCSELITNNYYKAISYTFSNFLLKFTIYPNTLDNSSLVIHELISSNQFDSSINQSTLEQIPKTFLGYLNVYLKENPVFLYEYQSILLNCEIIKIWDFLVNESDFTLECIDNKIHTKINNNNMPHVSTIHTPKKEGDKFIYNFGSLDHNNKTKYAIVQKIEQDFVKKQWSFSFELYHTPEYNYPYCIVNFFLLIIKDNQLFLSFHHNFKEPIEQKYLNLLAIEKKLYLNKIKKYFETLNKH